MQKSFTPGLLIWALGISYFYYRIRQTRIHIEKSLDGLFNKLDGLFNKLDGLSNKLDNSFNKLDNSFNKLSESLDLLRNDLQNIEDNRTGRNRPYVR